MSNLQKEKIRSLRESGNSYQRISEVLNLPIGTIKSYCSRNGIKNIPTASKDTCKNCGEVLVQKPKQKPRKFCSDACRMKWWSDNREARQFLGEKQKCKFCGKSYESYDEDSKYCSHPCYIADRFGKEKTYG